MTDSSEPIHPGKILYEMAMNPLGVSRNKLARDIDVPVGRISDIVAGKRGITPDTALRLGKYFGTSAEMWMQFQTDHDLHVARQTVWLDIAPRVRELEPGEVGAVAPVTAMDSHPEAADDYDPERAHAHDDSPDWQIEGESDETPAPPGDSQQPDEKWWSAPLSEHAADPSGAEVASSTETRAAVDDPPEAAITVDDATGDTEERPTEGTLTLEVEPAETAAQPVDATPAAVADDGDDAEEQTFEIDVQPSAAGGQAAPSEEQPAEPEAPQHRFTVEVMRNAPSAAGDDAATDVSEANHAVEAVEVDDQEFKFDLDDDEDAGEVPEDAFDGDFDSEFDNEFNETFESEASEPVEQEQPAPAIARTGTDDFTPFDRPAAATALDSTAATAGADPAASEPSPAATGIGGLSPANWSSALRSELPADGGPMRSTAPAEDASAATHDTPDAAPETGDVLAVPLPPEVEPAVEGPLPPWPPVDDDLAISLDIPDPADARKLFEYDD